MTDDAKLIQAKQVYQAFCTMMDREEWNYTKREEDLIIDTGARGEDLPMDLKIRVDAERELVQVFSRLPYAIPQDKRLEIAVAVSIINNQLVHGCVDFDRASGNLFFRMTNSYRDSLISDEVYKYLLYCACQTIDSFNDKLLMLSKGIIDIEKFIELYTKD